MKNLDEITMKEILDKISLRLTESDAEIIFNKQQEPINELQSRLIEIARSTKNPEKQSGLNGNALEELLIKYEDIANKGYLVLITLFNCQQYLEDNGKDISKDEREAVEKNIETAIQIIGKKDFLVASPIYDINRETIKAIKIINSQDLIRSVKKGIKIGTLNNATKKKLERMNGIEERVGLRNIIQVLSYEDIKFIISSDPTIGETLLNQISTNSVARYFEEHPEINTDEIEITQEFENEIIRSEQYIYTVIEVLMQNSRYIDIDKLLLVSAYRYIERLENNDSGEIGIKEIHDGDIKELDRESTVRILQWTVESIKAEISKGTVINQVANEEGTELNYSLEELEKDTRRFVDGRYIRKRESLKLKEKLLTNQITISEADEYELGLIHFSYDEIKQLLVNSEENIIYAIDRTNPSSEAILAVIIERQTCSERLFNIINEKGLLSASQVISLFDKGIIGKKLIARIEDPNLLNEVKMICMEILKETYLELGNSECDDKSHLEMMEIFDRYRALFKCLNLDGKKKEEIENATIQFISSFEDDIDSEKLEGLYQYGIISLEAAADWGVNLNQMLANNNIKPTDLKGLYKQGTITIDAIKNVLINGALPYEEKLDLIYSTFDGESEEEYNIREELVDLLETGEEYKAEGETTTRRKKGETTSKSREFVSDPHARWKLISLLDKEYSKKFLPTGCEVMDGHRVFLLPNIDKIVIEKMHEKRHGRKVSAYASATYIMETEEFFRNISSLIIEGAINRTALRELSEEEKATKIIHSSAWGNKIKEYFGIDAENERYTEAEIEEIDRAIENVEKSKKERE